MIRTSQHILKFANKEKLSLLQRIYDDYKSDLQLYINKILDNSLQLKSNLTSKLLPSGTIAHSQWKQIIYKNASEIVRSNLQLAKKKRYSRYKKTYSYFKKQNRQEAFTNKKFHELNLKDLLSTLNIDIKNCSITIDNRLLSNDFSSKKFDEFLGIKSPYFYENKKRAMQINLPIKWHKHSLKFSSWHRKKSIQVKKINDNFYVNFFYEKEDVKQKEKGNSIAFDIGYIKLLSDSNGNFYGKELKELYDKISKKKQGSKNFKQLLVHRDNEINRTINQIDLSNINLVIVEDLKNLFYKTKLSHKQMRKIQRMTYRKALNKLELVCQEKGIRIEKVSPSYSSQTCSKCGTIDKDSRNRELFQCASCNETLDADTNAARVLLHKGVYNPSNTKNNLSIFNGKL